MWYKYGTNFDIQYNLLPAAFVADHYQPTAAKAGEHVASIKILKRSIKNTVSSSGDLSFSWISPNQMANESATRLNISQMWRTRSQIFEVAQIFYGNCLWFYVILHTGSD